MTFDIIRAKVVLPTHGGHQKIIDGTFPFSKKILIAFHSPTKCSCHTKSSNFSGLRNEGIGSKLSIFTKIK
ncbi:MAG: hypothetical protein WCG25_01085 [bacterium]